VRARANVYMNVRMSVLVCLRACMRLCVSVRACVRARACVCACGRACVCVHPRGWVFAVVLDIQVCVPLQVDPKSEDDRRTARVRIEPRTLVVRDTS